MDPQAFPNFGGVDVPAVDLDHARAVILPLCYEQSPSYGRGSGSGPYHLLNASTQLERMDEEALIDWGLRRIHTCPALYPTGEPESAVGQMEAAAAGILGRGKFLLAIGGDHAASIGPIRAAAGLFKDLGVLQIDAHLDLRQEWNGSRFNHACVMRRVVEDMQLPAVQVGIRSFAPEEADYVRQKGLAPFYAHLIEPFDFTWIQRVVDLLPPRVYLTIDLDGLDPAVIPGTGTPEPGGLSYRQVVELIKAVGRRRKVVAADITELAKIEGTLGSEFTAAKLATKLLVYCL